MKKYCVSLELAKEMKALGFEQESSFYYTPDNTLRRLEYYREGISGLTESYQKNVIAAYTVGELGEMLPEYYSTYKIDNTWEGNDAEGLTINGDSEANTRAKMLIYLKKEGII